MNPFTFQTTPNVLFETGASAKLAGIVGGYGARRVMLVTDKGVRNAGLTKAAEDALAAAGMSVSVYDEVLADILGRDARDAARTAAPMRAAEDAIVLDTTDLDQDAAFARALELLVARKAA